MTEKEVIECNDKFISHPVVIEVVGQLMYYCERLDGLNILGIGSVDMKEKHRQEVSDLIDELISYVNICSDGQIIWDAWETMPDTDIRSDYGGSTEWLNYFYSDNDKGKLLKNINFSIR